MNKMKHKAFKRNPSKRDIVGSPPTLPFLLLPFLPIFYALSFWGLEEDGARVSLGALINAHLIWCDSFDSLKLKYK